VLAWRLFGTDSGLHLPARPERSARSARGRSVPVPRVAQQVVVRRAQHLLFIVIGGRLADATGGSTARSSTAPSTASAAHGHGRRDIRRVQTGRVQNYALGIAIGLLVMAGSYLLLSREPGMNLADMPIGILTIVTFLPLVGALVVAILPTSWTRPTALAFAARDLGRLAADAHRLRGVDGQPVSISSSLRLDPRVRHPVQARDRRLVGGARRADDDPDVDLHPRVLVPIQTRIKEYMISFLVLEVGMIGVFLALDLFLFYIFWEVVLVPMYLIIGIWGGANRIYATIKFVLYTLVGSLLMLVAILATRVRLPVRHGVVGERLRLRDAARLRAVRASPTLQVGAFLAFFLAFAIKVPMFPFHTWLPDATREAPTAGSVILAGILLKLGAYGFIRFAVRSSRTRPRPSRRRSSCCQLIAIIYGAIVALVQPDLNRLVAYSSVSQMGFVTLGAFVFTEQGAQGCDPPDDQPRPDHRWPVPAGRRHL
jgi:hypothetical protein